MHPREHAITASERAEEERAVHVHSKREAGLRARLIEVHVVKYCLVVLHLRSADRVIAHHLAHLDVSDPPLARRALLRELSKHADLLVEHADQWAGRAEICAGVREAGGVAFRAALLVRRVVRVEWSVALRPRTALCCHQDERIASLPCSLEGAASRRRFVRSIDDNRVRSVHYRSERTRRRRIHDLQCTELSYHFPFGAPKAEGTAA
mmetsp:Transcript_746/g.1921  ORF Transcript_746/g.1921 Transcript_746/m.1921 type:complete len:208 (+) Transcript_746:693-1316(+)